MNLITRAALADELQKIAGELQGHTRSGRRPIGVDRLLEREATSEVTPSDVVDESIGQKEKEANAASKFLSKNRTSALLVGTGAVGMHIGREANEDRKLGRQIRLQQRQ